MTNVDKESGNPYADIAMDRRVPDDVSVSLPCGGRVSAPTIGLKTADGSYVPILSTDAVGSRKRLVLTPAHTNQESVRVDLFHSDDQAGGRSWYVGSLLIENVKRERGESAEVSLVVGIDRTGNLNATIRDEKTGEYQSLSVSLMYLESVESSAEADGERMHSEEFPEFEIEEPPSVEAHSPVASQRVYRSHQSRPTEYAEPAHSVGAVAYDGGAIALRPNVALFLAYIIVCLGILGVAMYLIFRTLESAPSPGLQAMLHVQALFTSVVRALLHTASIGIAV